MAEQLLLELMADDTLAGFRLQRLEVYNWAPLMAGSGRCISTAKMPC